MFQNFNFVALYETVGFVLMVYVLISSLGGQRFLLLFSVVLGLLVGSNLVDMLRGILGNKAANILFLVSMFSATVLYYCKRAFFTGHKNSAKVILYSLGAILLGFMAWMVHPKQVENRYSDRLNDAQNAFKAQVVNTISGSQEDKERAYKKSLAVFYAAELEKKAFDIRREADPEYYSDTFLSKGLFICAIVIFFYGLWVFLRQKLMSGGRE